MIVDDFAYFFGGTCRDQRIRIIVLVRMPGIEVQRNLALAAVVEEPFTINLLDERDGDGAGGPPQKVSGSFQNSQ